MCEPFDNITNGEVYTYSTVPVPGFNATVVAVQNVLDFPFKPFFAGNGINVDETTNPGAITISYTGVPGLPYTHSTEIPGDATVVGTQVGNNFGFKSINGGTNIEVVDGPLIFINGPTYSSNAIPGTTPITDTQVLSDFRFRTLNAGTNITLDDTILPGAITISSDSPIVLQQNNTIFVDQQFGDDLSGTRERRDLPFQTINAAYAVAQADDTIHIFPGSYLEGLVVALPNINFYLNDGATWSNTGAPILSFTINSTYYVSGKGIFVANGIGSSIVSYTGPGTFVGFEAAEIRTSSGTVAFLINDCSMDIKVPLITATTQSILFNVTSNINPVNSIRLTSDEINWIGLLYNIAGVNQINFLIDANRIFNSTYDTSCRCDCENAKIEVRSNFMDLIVAPVSIYAIVNDTSANSATRSNVDVTFRSNVINMSQGRIVLVSSTKQSLYPRFHLYSNEYNVSNTTSSIINAANGTIFIKSNVAIVTNVSSQFCVVVGNLYLESDSFRWLTSNALFSTATNFYIRANTFLWSGLIDSENGYINCNYMESSNGRMTGLWNIKSNTLIMSDPNSSILTSGTGITRIECNSIVFNTGAANLAIVSNTGIQINARSMVFNVTAPHLLVTTASTNNIINVDYISNLVLSMSGELYISSLFIENNLANTSHVISTTGILNAQIEKINITNASNIFRATGTINSFNANFGTINHSLSGVAQPILFNASNRGVFNVKAKTINFNPSIPGYVFLSSSILSTSNIDIDTLNITGPAFRITGSTGLNLRVGTTSVNDLFFDNAATGSRSSLWCGYINSSATIISVSGLPTQFEISGNYNTTAQNVINISTNAAIGVNGAKLLSAGPCITSGVAPIVSVVPSSARFAPVGVTLYPPGALFISALLL